MFIRGSCDDTLWLIITDFIINNFLRLTHGVFNAVDKICFRNSENISRAQIPEHVIIVNLYFV